MTALLLILLTILMAYIYAGYPIILFILAKFFSRRHSKDDRHEPSVTLIISAHNEGKVIAAKIANTFELDYPSDKLTIIVISDGSTDDTDSIVRNFQDRGVILVRPEQRRGKTAGLNYALTLVASEVVVFSDANAMYDKYAIRCLVRHFIDEKVGYVVGHARYEETAETAAGSSEVAYWDIEVKMKEWESTFSSVVGGDGAIYAIRRHLYEPLQDTDINDFVNPLQIVTKGYRGIFDPAAWCTEKPAGEFSKEFSRKVRIANRSFNGLLRVPNACNPLKVGRFALLLVSHKMLRWFSPFLLALHFSVALAVGVGQSLLGSSVFIMVIFYGIFSVLALVGWWRAKEPKSAKLFYLPYYFMLMNLALVIGVVMRLRGRVISTWDTVREETNISVKVVKFLPIMLFGITVACCIRISLWLGFGDVLLYCTICTLIFVLLYTYLGYPCVLAVIARLKPVNIVLDEQCLPNVTLLIVAYNEEHDIEMKLCNSLALDYPRDLLQIVVASDGSTDATNAIVRQFKDQGVQLLVYNENRGKIVAINNAMEGIHTGIVAFSDANVMYDQMALRKLMRNFGDPRVGVVSGKVTLINDDLSYSYSERAFYCIEHFIQKKEGVVGALVGSDGAMYAIRRALFRSPSVDTILDDFVISMSIACEGYMTIHESEALGFERNCQEIKGELERKTRIIAGGFQCLLRGDVLPSFSRPVLFFNFISHKVLRWLNGLLILTLFALLILAYLTNIYCIEFFSLVLYFMVGNLIIAVIAQIVPVVRKIRLVNMVHYLFMLFLASLVGLYRELTGRQKVTWRGGSV